LIANDSASPAPKANEGLAKAKNAPALGVKVYAIDTNQFFEGLSDSAS